MKINDHVTFIALAGKYMLCLWIENPTCIVYYTIYKCVTISSISTWYLHNICVKM